MLDVGCGRGEFLALLRSTACRARGIDLNAAMVDVCRAKGLDAATADALDLSARAAGRFARRAVRRAGRRAPGAALPDAAARRRVRRSCGPGAPIVLETINPACWFAFFESYIRDITHVRPLHPDTLKYLLVASGFQQVEIRYRAPYPETDKLQPVGAARSEPSPSPTGPIRSTPT